MEKGACVAIATLEVQHLSKSFHSNRLRGRTHKAVDDVSLAIGPGQTYGLMGESGCGKSTLGRMITRLLPASSGTVLYDGTDLLYIPQRKMLPYRRRIQMLFQHPDTSLNPRMTVLDSLREPFLLHDLPGKQDMDEIIRAHIEPYGIQPELLERRASQVSGGQIQRIVLARIMLLQPEFIVLDEPTSMLDVSVPRSWICYTRFSSEPEYRIFSSPTTSICCATRAAGLASCTGESCWNKGRQRPY